MNQYEYTGTPLLIREDSDTHTVTQTRTYHLTTQIHIHMTVLAHVRTF